MRKLRSEIVSVTVILARVGARIIVICSLSAGDSNPVISIFIIAVVNIA